MIEIESSITRDSSTAHSELQDAILALKNFGECDWQTRTIWPNYSTFALNDQRINELLQIVKQESYLDFYNEDDCWVPVHAWRILAKAQVERAIPVLVDLLSGIEHDDDWAQTELPEIISMFGVNALGCIRKQLTESTLHGDDAWGHIALISALGQIAKDHVSTEDEVITLLTQLLADFEVNRPLLNSFLVSELVDLGEPRVLPLIRKVFARKFIDESVIDWSFVRHEFSGSEGISEGIKTEEYDINDFHYSGDERFQKLLKSLDSAFNIEELKCFVLGSHLAIELTPPSAIIEEVLTDFLDEEIDFETEGQAQYFYREFFGLWNELVEYRTKLFELPVIHVSSLSDLDERGVWSVKLIRLQWQLGFFLDGLCPREVDKQFLLNSECSEFILWIAEKIDELDESSGDLTRIDVAAAEKLFNEIHSEWNRDYLPFAQEIQEVRRREYERRKFIEEHKNVGRNDLCPCGSGKKFKKCCLKNLD